MNTESGLEFIHFIHAFRTLCLDKFFIFLNFFDTLQFFFVLIPFVWLSSTWKTGLKLFYILLLSSLVNHDLKESFTLPRPFHLDPLLGIIQVKGSGFPSGAAQNAILLSGLMVNAWKSDWKWLVIISYVFLISFSRLYLGVHFPSDLVGGWIVGYGLWAFYNYVFPLIEKSIQKCKPLGLLVVSILILGIFALIHHASATQVSVCMVGLGLSLGLYLNDRMNLITFPPKNLQECVLRSVIGVLGIFGCYFLMEEFFDVHLIFIKYLQFFCLGLWLSLGTAFIFGNKKNLST